MSFGLHESRRVARRRRRWRLFKWIFALAVLGGLGVMGFESGKTLSRRELSQAHGQIKQLTHSVAELQRDNAQLKIAAETARLQSEELKRRYGKEVPKGQVKDLMALINEQIAKGAAVARLHFLISAASETEKCDGKPVTKRILVATTLYHGANSIVTLAKGALTVTAEGTPAQDAQGRTQAWFDPSRSVTLTFEHLGGQKSQISGMLPLHHSVVVNGSEYRISIVPENHRGFVDITAERCKFP